MVAVVTDGHKYLTSASVPRGTAKETEELAIALALTQTKASTIITDSQEACRSFQSGWVAPVTLLILENKAPDRQVDIVWTPAHSSMRGNEHAHLTARDLAHQATEKTLEPTPLTTYQEITQHYRLNRRTLPAPNPSLTRSQETTLRLLQSNTFPHPIRMLLLFPTQFNAQCQFCNQPGTPETHHMGVRQQHRHVTPFPSPTPEQWETLLSSSLPQDQLLLVEKADRARTENGYLN
ncbi:hypothetical protein HPB47_025138 [Ixodes persulcatus]|uniref:Uncharacterized protein n=1 Tax=Ixodes persulcatus TaxID=34615 RepID=A0AC60Q4P7_IXOPE|nr:hypothetical protein HPB47_025138 [Ixodes persulcatus]